MKRIGTLGLCVLAVLAVAAVASSSASAKLPEWGKCTATGGSGGRYEDAACTVKAKKHKGEYTGGYEWTSLSGRLPTAYREAGSLHMSGGFTLVTASGQKIECEEMSPVSETDLFGPNGAITPLWKFRECFSEGEARNEEEEEEGCATQLSSEGEINTLYLRGKEENGGEGWKGTLGFIAERHGATPVVGMRYQMPERERAFAPIVCHGPIGTVWIGGEKHGGNAFISQIQPVNQMTAMFTETFRESSPGVQDPERFERGHKGVLRAFVNNHWESVAIGATFEYGFSKGAELELKATP